MVKRLYNQQKFIIFAVWLKRKDIMKKKRKSKELKEKEDDLLFYLEYWKKFPNHFQKIAQKEIDELEDRIKND